MPEVQEVQGWQVKLSMANELDTLLIALRDRISKELGLFFAPHRLDTLRSRVLLVAQESGFDESQFEDFLSSILNRYWDRATVTQLVKHLTIAETYFFRDHALWDHFECSLIPELKRRLALGRSITIWSSSCCTGEEPYTVALLLKENFSEAQLAKITIVGTDINEHYLERARLGIYSEYSLRTIPASMREKYFKVKSEHRFELEGKIRDLVDFHYLNLVDQPLLISKGRALTSVDLIFCRNTLIYFDDTQIGKTLGNLAALLAPDGWCFLGPAETWKAPAELFSLDLFPGVISLRPIESVPAKPSPSKFVPLPQLAPVLPQSFAPSSLGQAETLYQSGFAAEALALLANNKNDSTQDVASLKFLAKCHAYQGQFEQATDLIGKAIEADSLDAGLYYIQAMLQLEVNDLTASAGSLRQAIFLNPNLILAQYMLGCVCIKQKRYEQAKIYISNAQSILSRSEPQEILEESGGLTAGRLLEIMTTIVSEPAASSSSIAE